MKCGLTGRFRDWADKTGLHRQRDDIVKASNLCLQTPVINKLEDKLLRRPLRDAFNRIKADPSRAVKRALLDLKLCNEGAVKRLLFYWYLNAMTGRKNDQIHSLKKHPNIVSGAERLA
jgi:hypothetical protein